MSKFIVPIRANHEKILEQAKASGFPVDAFMLESILQVLQFVNAFSSTVEKHFARYALSQGRFGVMILLFTQSEATWTPADLAEYAGVSRATITGLLDGLEKQGWVERDAHPKDRRRLIIRLTPSGKQFLQSMLPDHFHRVTQWMSVLSHQEQKTLVSLLDKVSQGLKQMDKN